jgi:hypothetical protein
MNLKKILINLGLYKPTVKYKYQPDENHIEVLNFWSPDPKNTWHYQFLKQNFSDLITSDNSVLISTVFGPKKAIELSESKVKVFYTGENVSRFPEYKDQCKGIVDVAIGFDYNDEAQYQRFPIWLEYFFPQTSTKASIQQSVSQFVVKNICDNSNKQFTSLVSNHDKGNIRKILFDSLSKIDKIDSGGKFLNNTQALKNDFGDDKRQFIGHYKFNICPENSNREGYVTEKVFEAIRCNTIPVYWGSNNNPEPDVLNKDAILFYNGPESLPALQKTVEELHNNPKLYAEFLNQEKFKPHAAEYIADIFDGLYTKIHKALSRK